MSDKEEIINVVKEMPENEAEAVRIFIAGMQAQKSTLATDFEVNEPQKKNI